MMLRLMSEEMSVPRASPKTGESTLMSSGISCVASSLRMASVSGLEDVSAASITPTMTVPSSSTKRGRLTRRASL